MYFKLIQLSVDVLLFTDEEGSQDFGVCEMSTLHQLCKLWFVAAQARR
jgi:hypothetical protein